MKEYEQKINNIIGNTREEVISQANQAYKRGYRDGYEDGKQATLAESEQITYCDSDKDTKRIQLSQDGRLGISCMNKLKVYPGNEKYYSKEFIQGWESGVKNQYDADVDFLEDFLDEIRAEIERLHHHPKLDFIKNDDVVEMALEVIDKYK